jgi:predicted Zn-dependent protease
LISIPSMTIQKFIHHRTLRILNALVLFITLGLLPACSVNPATGENSFTAFMSPEKEKQIGAEEHPKIIKQFSGAYDDIELSAYVAEIGFRLTQVSELPNNEFHFTVLNDDTINAFALPGGYIYVTRGLIALAENEAELAGVIAHEIGHVTARHTAERHSKTMAANIGLTILGVVGSIYGAPRSATDFLSAGAESLLKGFSREQELQADMLGVRYISRAGYNPDSMSSFFKKMKGHDELQSAISGRPTNEENFNHASTHPRTSDRINQAIELARDVIVENPKIETELFLSNIDGIIFGDDPHQGVRRGRDFLHPDLKLHFTVPEGFILQNTPTQVIARHKNDSVIIFDMENPKNAKKVDNLKNYLVHKWGSNMGLEGIDKLNINGMEAWTGFVRRNTRSGPRDIRLIAIRGDNSEIFRLAFITPIDAFDNMAEGLKRMTYSFSRLSQQEADAIEPLRIKIINAAANDTSQTLAKRMSENEFSKEWFELLNMVALQDGLNADKHVKIIDE